MAELVTDTKNYLSQVSLALLGCNADSLGSALDATKVQKFIEDPRASLYVTVVDDKVDVAFDLIVANEDALTATFVKVREELVSTSPLASQIQVVTLKGPCLDTVHSTVRSSLAPLLRTYARSHGGQRTEGVERRLAELERSLFSARQSADLEEVRLVAPPRLAKILQERPNASADDADLSALSSDASFLNELQQTVNGWARQVQKLTRVERVERVPQGSSVSQETRFWEDLERELSKLEEQLRQPQCSVALALLRRARRFHATQPFDADTLGMREAAEKAKAYRPLTRGFPADAVPAAQTLQEVATALKSVFEHMRKSRKTSQYPLARYIRLSEALSRDVVTRVRDLLASRSLLAVPYEGFMAEVSNPFDAVFEVWKTEFADFCDMLREIRDRQGNDRVPFQFDIQHQDLIDRVASIVTFRKQHEELQRVVRDTLQKDPQALQEIQQAYNDAVASTIDLMDLTLEGANRWKDLVHSYNLRIDRVETRIVSSLRAALTTTRNASDMFAVFAQYNALFVRPRIRGAIAEYQDVLINQVRTDVEDLASRLREGYPNSVEARLDRLNDMPPVAGSIVWARQLQQQLEELMRRVEDVLGSSWSLNVHGKKLKQDGDLLRDKLDTEKLFKDWVEDTKVALQAASTGPDHQISGFLLNIAKRGKDYVLSVAFDERLIVLFKEVRNLVWLGYRVPFAITLLSSNVRQVYPHVVSLRQLVRTYNSCVADIEADGPRMLVAEHHKNCQQVLANAVKLKWSSLSKLQPLVVQLTAAVNAFKSALRQALDATKAVKTSLESLKTCPYETEEMRKHLAEIQKQCDALDLAGHSNLRAWAKSVQQQVEEVLTQRLSSALDGFSRALGWKDEKVDPSAPPVLLQECLFNIVVRNGTMVLDPPLAQGRASLLKQLSTWMHVVVKLSPLQAGRYSLSDQQQQAGQDLQDHSHLLSRVTTDTLCRVYKLVEEKMSATTVYVSQWLRYQGLWDMDQTIYTQIGQDQASWQQLLQEIKQARQLFEGGGTVSNEASALFPLRVDTSAVRASVSNKYDFWHRDILHHFGERVAQDTRTFYDQVSRLRQDFEGRSVAHDSAEGAVEFVIHLQDVQRKLPAWQEQVNVFGKSQDTLRKHRWTFPSDWLPFEMIEAEWSAFTDLVKRRQQALEQRIPILSQEILKEIQAAEQSVTQLHKEWDNEGRPKGSQSADTALHALSVFAARAQQMQDRWVRLQSARHALSGEALADASASQNGTLSAILSECVELKDVWTQLGQVWKQLRDVGQQAWGGVIPRRVRTALDDLIQLLRGMPAKIKQYEAFDRLQSTIKSYLECNGIIVDLKSEALRDRHWNELRKRLRAKWVWGSGDLTLQDIWDSDLKANGLIFKDIITQAQGEMALEVFLQQVREHWEATNLDMINYRGKCSLIRGWDDLFQKLTDHINSLTAMRMSPYYRVFEAEASSWDDKLNKIYALLDIWIDVQRRWVYLEGIFSGSAEIGQLLPVETQRFRSVNGEFLTLMRKTAAAPNVLVVGAIEGVHRGLEKLLESLSKIQKALGEYLEKQRSAFPRFYFVGDEDLLEIIGAGKDVTKIQKHFKKMFQGLASVELDAQQSLIAMLSAEGERLAFPEPFSSANYKINEWLTLLEQQSKLALCQAVDRALVSVRAIWPADLPGAPEGEALKKFIEENPAQACILALQVAYTQDMETKEASKVLARLDAALAQLARNVLGDLSATTRRKHEHIIGDLVHQRDVARRLAASGASGPTAFGWLSEMRFYWDATQKDPLARLVVKMANASFPYGWEYQGVGERLVQTPLTDRCYLTLTQALNDRFGGSPAGPAGTGKTETVKALGGALGRFTLVFCCDDSFDFQAMGRIFVGLCETGSWGCFDEFNRLEERILSAVSQQIQQIQEGLKAKSSQIELSQRQVNLSQGTGIFITMNPGYAGRVELPDNLKQLFRPIAMVRPDLVLIAQVMLFGQGFGSAERLAHKVVPLFDLMREQLSSQSHYDWGLRALKTVLIGAGILKRKHNAQLAQQQQQDEVAAEEKILLQSVWDSVAPKLLHDDIVLFISLLGDVFPGSKPPVEDAGDLNTVIRKVCEEEHLVFSEAFAHKITQVHQTIALRHGMMMVGPSGSGKSTALRILSEALTRHTQVPHIVYALDAKAMHKDALYGSLESTTREWTDGLFTHILRKIIENVRGESAKVHWIVFDGDVDPEWVENLNSVLDDNKLLTLPNGERLALPDNVRILFEVDSLRYATPATVSRCGMVWFSDSVVTQVMVAQHYLKRLESVPLDATENALVRQEGSEKLTPPGLALQRVVQATLRSLFVEEGDEEGPLLRVLREAATWPHIMDMTRGQMLNTLNTLTDATVLQMHARNLARPDFQLAQDQIDGHVRRTLCSNMLWAFGGSLLHGEHKNKLQQLIGAAVPTDNYPDPLEEHFADLEDGVWRGWAERVPSVEIETHQAASPDVVIPTVDTIRHRDLIARLLERRAPLILCGPPGSGKTMTLFSTLQSLPDVDVVTLNFSSATSPELLLSTFAHHCEYKVTPKGPVLRPTTPGKWLVLFCDEINLPAPDKYGTQRVITFLRQLTERQGFWRESDHTWVHLEHIQFVGACNPPTDPGRVPLSQRFLRFAPVVMVGFPNRPSLHAIYGTMNRALLKLVPEMRAQAEALTQAMLDVYSRCQERFTPDMHAHYIFSPRELSRWVRSLYSALSVNTVNNTGTMTVDELVRLWLHEGLRLFQDRLVEAEERRWLDEAIDAIALERFGPGLRDNKATLKRPVLFSSWTSNRYIPVERQELREYVKQRLKVFYEEELDVPLVLFNEVLDHILRIDRVFRQPQGHALLIGVSGGGKTVLSRFVAWLNGLNVFTIKVNSRYSFEDFRADLRKVMLNAGAHDEKMCFIFDESNVLDSNFLELMNTLLASGDVPGLFEGDDLTQLLAACKDATNKRGIVVDSDNLYNWFISQVRINLHVVFTMNPASPDFHNRSATSPALFNRCVLDWFGDWSETALFQVAHEFTRMLDMDGEPTFQLPAFAPPELPALLEEVEGKELGRKPSHRDSCIYALVHMHSSVRKANRRLHRLTGRQNYLTPRHFLDLIGQVVSLVQHKREELEEQQLHLNVGLRKLQETEQEVTRLRSQLSDKKRELEAKDRQANEKLLQMVGDQQEAERKRQESIQLQEKLAVQDVEISKKKALAEQDLAKAEPAVEEAKKSVSSIQKSHLDEIRALRKPPAMIQRVLEAVCLMLGHGKLDWERLRKVLMEQTFISQVVGFDSKNIPKEVRQELLQNYVSDETFNYEAANRASKACGPLVKWLIAQVEFSEILNRVAPLREEVARLEDAAQSVKKQAQDLATVVQELESKIARLKEEYASLIRETEQIKGELETVGKKVERSVSLLANLSSESERWKSQSQSFIEQMRTVVGDCLLGAGFLSYIGPFDQSFRAQLLRDWRLTLEQVGISFREQGEVVDFLCLPSQRLEWRNFALPPDELCVENAVMLTRFNRYPLVIDPSGQATTFLMNMLASRKVVKTSFLDAAFQKNLESALRFGCPIVVEDVENIDPVLNPILNKEVRKQGGRVLIRLGDQDIDFSPSFVIYMTTRDPTAHFTPDLCSRVTLVNFTVTRAGLTAQCLSQIMRTERPDVEERRANAMKQQGEFRVALRQKEQQLLDCISRAEGNLLQDDNVVRTLENLKKDAFDIEQKVKEAEGVVQDVLQVQQQYGPVAERCAGLYFALEGLNMVHFLYQISLQQYQRCFTVSLGQGFAGLEDRLMRMLYQRVARSLLNVHKPSLSLRLAIAKASPPSQEVEYLLGNTSEFPQGVAPGPWEKLLRARSSHLMEEEASRYVAATMGQEGWGELPPLRLQQELEGEQLIMLVGSQGNDPGYLVDDLASASAVKKYERIAIGSAEGFAQADKALQTLCKGGGWLLLRNVHLAPSWLQQLEKRLHNSQPFHKDFRVFLTCDPHPAIPASLLLACRVLTFENPPGLRASVLQNLRSCSNIERPPAERARLHYLVCYAHALLTERLRFVPLGWSKQVAFSQTDLVVALRTVDAWIDSVVPAGRANVDPEKGLPWEAIRSLLCEVVYGGRIDNDQDQRILESVLKSVLNSRSYEEPPEPQHCRNVESIAAWAATALPEGTPPQLLGLPAMAEQLVAQRRGEQLVRSLHALMASSQEDTGAAAAAAAAADEAGDTEDVSALQHLQKVAQLCKNYLDTLPKALADCPAQGTAAIPRFWKRDFATANRLLHNVRNELEDVCNIQQGKSHFTNDSRALVGHLAAGRIPPHWRRAYTVPKAMQVNAWIADFLTRLNTLSAMKVVDAPGVQWLGGILSASAFVTATRQHACLAKGWALESMKLEARVLEEGAALPTLTPNQWITTGLTVQGAKFENGALHPTEATSHKLPPLLLSWEQQSQNQSKSSISVPVYLNDDRSDLLFSIHIPVAEGKSPEALVKAGIAFLTWGGQ